MAPAHLASHVSQTASGHLALTASNSASNRVGNPQKEAASQKKPVANDGAPPKVRGNYGEMKRIGVAPLSNLYVPAAQTFGHLSSRSAQASRQFVERARCSRQVANERPGPVHHAKHENLEFYRNRLPCYPRGDLVENIHEKWWGDYRLLETHHSYIQWLFPNRRRGANRLAPPLASEEAEAMRNDPKIRMRVLRSFEMMLDFFGMKLKWDDAGRPENQPKTADNARGSPYFERTADWEERYYNLRERSHNNLRITRILLCLGELGWKELQVAWVKFLAWECFCGALADHSVQSLVHHWLPSVDDGVRHSLQAEFASFLNKRTANANGHVRAALVPMPSGKSDQLVYQKHLQARYLSEENRKSKIELAAAAA
eukprot:gnl/MRDRNA2_/MRDRNA2_118222_c0_seq1.p1 gnl/MRDRNA2_/MRDRNA2_118222_c0~~gnl/MRDRNA2_/MRDRNA2_118222_c0_seq1.p1  ORF type:complete len:390 (-),score=64.88 gnl/MRDRNA2_/MRDRNA2_118222_c0_seq1:346-1461(-)